MKLKKLYNKWLFRKYKYNRESLFENIPYVKRMIKEK